MDAYRQRQLGGLQYQLQFYQGLQNEAISNQAQKVSRQNEATMESLIKQTGKKSIFSTLGTALTTVGAPLAFSGVSKIGKNLMNKFKAEGELNTGEEGPTGLTNARYDRDMNTQMSEFERNQPTETEPTEAPEVDENPDFDGGEETDLTGFYDPSFENKLSTFKAPSGENVEPSAEGNIEGAGEGAEPFESALPSGVGRIEKGSFGQPDTYYDTEGYQMEGPGDVMERNASNLESKFGDLEETVPEQPGFIGRGMGRIAGLS